MMKNKKYVDKYIKYPYYSCIKLKKGGEKGGSKEEIRHYGMDASEFGSIADAGLHITCGTCKKP